MAKKQLTYVWDDSGSELTVKDGEKELARFDFADVPESLDAEFLKIGRRTKIGNFATDKNDTLDERIAAMKAGFQMLREGKWEADREGGPRAVSVEAEALAELKGITVGNAQKALAALRKEDPEKAKKVLENPKLVKIAERIKADREANEDVDLSDLA